MLVRICTHAIDYTCANSILKNIHTYIQIHTYIHTIHTYIPCLPTYLQTYIPAHLRILTFLHIYLHTYIPQTHTYIHTYIHTMVAPRACAGCTLLQHCFISCLFLPAAVRFGIEIEWSAKLKGVSENKGHDVDPGS